MKKKLLLILSILLISSSFSNAYAKTSSVVTEAIGLYKKGNYTECYAKLNEYVKNDPSNALAYYYLAISATQIGRREDAIDFYNKTLSLTSSSSNLGRYAAKGKSCLEDELSCKTGQYVSAFEELLGDKAGQSSTSVKGEFEKLKIENLMREMNRNNNIPAQRFKEFKDFSSMNTNEVPTNDEIVAALRTLQRAGLSNIGNNYSDLSLLTGSQNDNMLNLMGGNMNPQIMQALFTNNMSLGF